MSNVRPYGASSWLGSFEAIFKELKDFFFFVRVDENLSLSLGSNLKSNWPGLDFGVIFNGCFFLDDFGVSLCLGTEKV